MAAADATCSQQLSKESVEQLMRRCMLQHFHLQVQDTSESPARK